MNSTPLLAKICLRSLLMATLVVTPVFAQPETPQPANNGETTTYRIIQQDVVSVSVFDEPDMDVEQRVDANGQIRLPLLGNFCLAGMSVRNAEAAVERAYVQREFLRRPQVTINVVEYAPREIAVLGCVVKPGNIALPAEDDSIDIVALISQAGDFTRVAKRDAVVVRRRNAKGELDTSEVDVADLITGRGDSKGFRVYPGDVVYVPERLF